MVRTPRYPTRPRDMARPLRILPRTYPAARTPMHVAPLRQHLWESGSQRARTRCCKPQCRCWCSPADFESLRRQAIQEIRGFEERARRAEVPAEDILAARYALCTAIDEAVLNTPWGAQSDWSGHSLLVTFHREAAGGEKFFQILDRVSKEPQRYLALLELLYVCL